ncbi:MAG TPA: glycosyltransferase family 4 protein [Solirubrobacteraceae bacterium]
MSARSVLLVNHTASVSGAEHSLLDLLGALPDEVVPVVACPPGPLAEAVAELGVRVVPLRGTDAGLKLHPTGTPRALAKLLADGVAVARAARRAGAVVVHANSTRAALACAIARASGGPALAVHVHDVLGRDRVSSVVRRVIAATADAVLANSKHVAASFIAAGPEVVVVENPVDLDRFDPARVDGRAARRELGIGEDEPVLALVGQITPWKGQDTAIRALAALPERFDAARLLIVGEPVFASAGTRYDNVAYLDELRRLTRELGLEQRVAFLGARADVPDLLAATDIALMPSWEEPFGRVAIEAMAMRVPVLATDRGGPREILAGGGGMLLAPRQPELWAAAITELLDDPQERRRMGETGRQQAVLRYHLAGFVRRVLAGWDAAERARASGRRRAGPQLRPQRDEPDADGQAEDHPEDDVAAGLRLLR